MEFALLEKKGLSKCLFDKDINPEKFHIHISEIAPGTSSHSQHTHNGIETLYIFEGTGEVKVEEKTYFLGPNETIVMDANKIHGLTNTGKEPLRYMIIKVN